MARLLATPRWSWCACLAVVGACAVDDPADRVESRTALDRPGVYHTGLNVRVVDDQGRPVEATVSIDGPWAGIGRDRGGRGVLRIESRDVPPELASVVMERREGRGRETVVAQVPAHRIDLRFVDNEGEPITSARVSVAGNPREPAAITDADGRISMATVAVPEQLLVSGPWGFVTVGIESPKDWELASRGPPDVVADLIGQSEIAIPVQRRVEIAVSGLDPGDLVYSSGWGREWRTVDQTLIERVFGDRTWQILLRAEAPQRLPRFAAYPVPERLEFDFAEDKQHVLVAVDEGGPIADAIVDLVEVATPYLDRVSVNDPEADIFLGSQTTDADGRLARLGDPRALYVAYVYADGYDPIRTLLHAGSETRVELAKRDVRVGFTGLRAGELLRVKVAGGDSLVALHRNTDAPDVVVSLAPGTYDATVENADSIIDWGTTFVLAKEPRVVDTTVDRRPVLKLRLPELPVVPEKYWTDEEATAASPPVDRWAVWSSRRTPPGGAVGALATTSFGGAGAAGESPVEVEALQEPGGPSRILRFSGSGRWLVFLGAQRRAIDNQYFIEVEMAAGEKRELGMPPLDASLQGSYERELVANHHGVAGPRLMLIRAEGADSGWNVVNRVPGEVLRGRYDVEQMVLRAPADAPEHHDFAMRDLPAGEYHLFHHLGEESVWGGIEFSLRNGATTKVPRLGSDEPGTWTVEVVDSEGRPIRDQVLRVRDRMHEAWEAFSQIPTTAAYAADGIPLPPAARLRGEPVAFESIRPGWVELVLDDPAGPARHYLRKAHPGSKLTLVVDD